MYVEGTVRSTDGTPIPNAVIETWETDESGFYDTQYSDRDHPDCRGRLKTDKDGKFGYRAVTPVSYPIPGDVSVIFDPLMYLSTNTLRLLGTRRPTFACLQKTQSASEPLALDGRGSWVPQTHYLTLSRR